jgi:hypothetical protein
MPKRVRMHALEAGSLGSPPDDRVDVLPGHRAATLGYEQPGQGIFACRQIGLIARSAVPENFNQATQTDQRRGFLQLGTYVKCFGGPFPSLIGEPSVAVAKAGAPCSRREGLSVRNLFICRQSLQTALRPRQIHRDASLSLLSSWSTAHATVIGTLHAVQQKTTHARCAITRL